MTTTGRARGRRLAAVSALSLALLALAPSITTGQGSEKLTVTATGGGVSLHAVDAPLDQVLAQLGQAVNARIVVETVLAADLAKTRVTRSFTELSPVLAFRRLLAGRNYALFQGAQGVDEVRIFVDGKTGYRDLRAPATARVNRPTATIPLESPPGDQVDVARLREAALGAPDADARRQALEELSGTGELGMLRDTLTQALARERDGRVLETLVELASQHPDAVPADALRALVASDRDETARALAVHHLAAHTPDDPATRNLLRTVATGDASADVRAAAESALEGIDAHEDRPERPAARTPTPGRRGRP